MIENWQTPDGLKVIGIMGPPAWGFEYQKGYAAEREVVGTYHPHGQAPSWDYSVRGRDTMKGVTEPWEHIHSLDAEEAVNHYRDAALGWLRAKYKDIRLEWNAAPGLEDVLLIEKWDVEIDDYVALINATDYDAALIAAILAGEKK